MEYYVGQICHFPYHFIPYGFLPCNGRKLVINDYSALHALLGHTYGGDRYNFNLPDLRGKSPLDQTPEETHYYIAVQGIFPSLAF